MRRGIGPGLEFRFWAKVDKRGPDECWNWTASKDSKGYGHLRVDNTTQKAHRLSYEIANGPIPTGLLVCHRCDNRRCVNPAHLFLGTAKDNAEDMVNKGRQARGDTHPGTLLTTAQCLEIIWFYESGQMSQRQLADKYGVSRGAVRNAIQRIQQWRREGILVCLTD